MTLRQRRQSAVRVRVELDENEIPNLDAARVAGIHERSLGVAGRREIDVQFRARTARAGIAHHPEIVLLVAVDDVNGRIEPRFREEPRPMIVRFLVELARLARPRFVNRRVKTLRRKFPALDHQFPRPVDRFLLEVIAEAPVAEHLEERVVIRIESDVIQIVMLPAGPDALLGVDDAGRIPRRLLLAEKNGDELVHAGIREKQVRRVRQQRTGRHDRVLFLAKEIEKGLADLGGGHVNCGCAGSAAADNRRRSSR